MKLGHLADIHLGHRQYGLNQREDDMANTFEATLRLIMQDDPDAILLPGNLFDSRDLRPKILEAAERGLSVVPVDSELVSISGAVIASSITPSESVSLSSMCLVTSQASLLSWFNQQLRAWAYWNNIVLVLRIDITQTRFRLSNGCFEVLLDDWLYIRSWRRWTGIVNRSKPRWEWQLR